VLELVAGRQEGLTLSELARDVSAPVSSMQSLVNGLVATGFLDRSGSRYFLGPAPYVLTRQARQNTARLVTHGDLTNLAEDGGYTVLFAVRIGDDAVTIDEAGHQPLLEYLARTRQRVPLLTASVGKVMLAALPDDELHSYLRRSSRPDLADEFLGELASIRQTGVSVSVWPDPPPGGDPEGKTGVVATVVRDHDGHVVGAACIGHDFEHFKRHLGPMTQTLLRHVRHWEMRPDEAEPEPVPPLRAAGSRATE